MASKKMLCGIIVRYWLTNFRIIFDLGHENVYGDSHITEAGCKNSVKSSEW